MLADEAIKRRKTQKVLAGSPWPIPSYKEAFGHTIRELLELAAAAPYHKKAHDLYTEGDGLNSCLPYRFYVLDSINCRSLLEYIHEQDMKTGKIGEMLAAADALFLVTWLPEPEEGSAPGTVSVSGEAEPVPFEGSIRNMEHIAAASAAIQNVLIGATARHIPSYWSSGGHLRNAPLRKFLGVPLSEIMLGAIFLFPKLSDQGEAQVIPGKLRDEGKAIDTWSKMLDI